MKKFIFTIACFVIAVTSIYALTNNNSSTTSTNTLDSIEHITSAPIPGIIITVHIGRPSKDCTGFGFCGASSQPSASPIKADNIDGNLSLTLSEERREQFKDYFGGEHIIMEEEYTLDYEIASKLKLPKGYTIKKGKYNFEKIEGSDDVVVKF